MATYDELSAIQQTAGFEGLQDKLGVAVAVKATAMLDVASPTAGEVAWAVSALRSPRSAALDVMWYVVAANKSASIAQIIGADDSAVQTNVDAAVDKIAAV